MAHRGRRDQVLGAAIRPLLPRPCGGPCARSNSALATSPPATSKVPGTERAASRASAAAAMRLVKAGPAAATAFLMSREIAAGELVADLRGARAASLRAGRRRRSVRWSLAGARRRRLRDGRFAFCHRRPLPIAISCGRNRPSRHSSRRLRARGAVIVQHIVGRIVLRILVRFGLHVGDRGLELQPEIDRRIDEGGDRRKRDLRAWPGLWLKLRPTWKPSSSTFRSQNLFCSTIVISSGSARADAAGIETPGAPVLKVM